MNDFLNHLQSVVLGVAIGWFLWEIFIGRLLRENNRLYGGMVDSAIGVMMDAQVKIEELMAENAKLREKLNAEGEEWKNQ